MTATVLLTTIVATPLVAAALIPTIHDMAARCLSRRERQWLAQWRAHHTTTLGDTQ